MGAPGAVLEILEDEVVGTLSMMRDGIEVLLLGQNAGVEKSFRHRLVVYTGEVTDKEITEQWSVWSGQKHTSALWGIAQREGREAKFLTPQEAVDAMTVKEGFTANV